MVTVMMRTLCQFFCYCRKTTTKSKTTTTATTTGSTDDRDDCKENQHKRQRWRLYACVKLSVNTLKTHPAATPDLFPALGVSSMSAMRDVTRRCVFPLNAVAFEYYINLLSPSVSPSPPAPPLRFPGRCRRGSSSCTAQLFALPPWQRTIETRRDLLYRVAGRRISRKLGSHAGIRGAPVAAAGEEGTERVSSCRLGVVNKKSC